MTTSIVNASPTKKFFVRMLTRDIGLSDAILDLLDNCIDGVVRERGPNPDETAEKPYNGYWAKITATPDNFVIHDNCGGITREIAENSAFMLGRPDPTLDSSVETVGMYGIGMKRAMFKIGQHSTVVTRTRKDGSFTVDIPQEWLTTDDPKNPDTWKLKLQTSPKELLEEYGTRIEIKLLNEGISRQFDPNRSDFISDLYKEISRHYALIIEKGFLVELNGRRVIPVPLTLLSPATPSLVESDEIRPYAMIADIDNVHVELVIGFYRPLATQQEIEAGEHGFSSRELAGWTVICNDRVVLYNNKEAITGWGTASVPAYHNQFISITGIVSFRSPTSEKLPLNTTKRGIDTSSPVYLTTLDYMREGMKVFTGFTYTWKRREQETVTKFSKLKSIKSTELIKTYSKDQMTTARRRAADGVIKYFTPNLPRPTDVSTNQRICFSADKSDIETVRQFYFGSGRCERGEIGLRCFTEALELARRSKQ